MPTVEFGTFYDRQTGEKWGAQGSSRASGSAGYPQCRGSVVEPEKMPSSTVSVSISYNFLRHVIHNYVGKISVMRCVIQFGKIPNWGPVY